MKMQVKSTSSLSNVVFNNVVNLPTPFSINYIWNTGSMLGIVLLFQIFTGLFLSMHYNPGMPFYSLVHISRDVNMGIEMRFFHSNGASLFFILVFTHVVRGIMNNSFKKLELWVSGVFMFIMLMGTSFLGYVLPWGQMSFWGATVITNLLSTIPILGDMMVQWLWGGFSVGMPTLNRFFSLHFMFPFLIGGLSIIHLLFLHNVGSSNPLGVNSDQEKLNFNPFFSWKDLLMPTIVMLFFMLISLKIPYLLMDPENFSFANSMSTPVHIQPEWYFLFAYALLRSIPSKLGGVIILVLSIMVLVIIPVKNCEMTHPFKFSPINKIKISLLVFSFIMLTWLGAMPMETPYMLMSKIMGVVYFISMLS